MRKTLLALFGATQVIVIESVSALEGKAINHTSEANL